MQFINTFNAEIEQEERAFRLYEQIKETKGTVTLSCNDKSYTFDSTHLDAVQIPDGKNILGQKDLNLIHDLDRFAMITSFLMILAEGEVKVHEAKSHAGEYARNLIESPVSARSYHLLHADYEIQKSGGILSITNLQTGQKKGEYNITTTQGSEKLTDCLKSIEAKDTQWLEAKYEKLFEFSYYPTGEVKRKIQLANGVRDGVYTEYYPNGNVRCYGTTKKGKFDGKLFLLRNMPASDAQILMIQKCQDGIKTWESERNQYTHFVIGDNGKKLKGTNITAVRAYDLYYDAKRDVVYSTTITYENDKESRITLYQDGVRKVHEIPDIKDKLAKGKTHIKQLEQATAEKTADKDKSKTKDRGISL